MNEENTSTIFEPKLVALVATYNRPTELVKALESVRNQTRHPDMLVVVDDSDSQISKQNCDFVEGLKPQNFEVVYLENYRTRGASGAWNTGLDWILRESKHPTRVYIAILDDDDTWEPEHLQVCYDTALQKDYDMVVSGIIRHDWVEHEGRPQTIPKRLNANDFLVGNPHIQGSNLFVRLSKLLQAGLFDEGLTSSTDRDLCIRLADLGDVHFGTVPHHTVHHHAEYNTLRLSSSGSESKIAGLNAFWGKYQSRMTASQQQRFLERAKSLFGWDPSNKLTVNVPKPPRMNCSSNIPSITNGAPYPLVVGITTDAKNSDRVTPLLYDLLTLSVEPELGGLDILILENGSHQHNSQNSLQSLVQQFRQLGLRCYLIDRDQQITDAKVGLFGDQFQLENGRYSIACCRTMLQTYLYIIAQSRLGSIVWILDDDKRLDSLVYHEKSGIQREYVPILKQLLNLRDTGVDVVLGVDTDSPPLPFISTIRTQLVDLDHNLTWMGQLDPNHSLPNRFPENLNNKRRCRDYYYDLSRTNTDHLETPFWLIPASENETVREAFIRLGKTILRILSGEEIFRPLFVEYPDIHEINTTPSIYRGGNTFVFDLETLRDVPNIAPELNGLKTRRSDMIWALLNKYGANKRIISAPIPVRHDRSDITIQGIEIKHLVSDIQGYAVYSALEDLLKIRRESGKAANNIISRDNLEFSTDELTYAVTRVNKYLTERLAAFELSYHRVLGLVKVLRRFINPEISPQFWWHNDLNLRDTLTRITDFVERVEQEYRKIRPNDLRQQIKSLDESIVREFLCKIRDRVDDHQVDISNAGKILANLKQQREEIAQEQVKRLNMCRELVHLGNGIEGVVFTDGEHVFKYFDYWKYRTSDEQRQFIRGLVGKWSDTRVLYPLLDLKENGVHTVLMYPYEEGQTYTGGHGDGLVQLLRECREQGIICRNIHPSNLLVTDTGLRLIDYGSDLHPFSEDEFLHMCRRAWLTWRWHHHTDLKELMRQALTDDSLPELDGFECFLKTIKIPSKGEILDERIIIEVLKTKPKRVLDFGCGKGKLVPTLATQGIQVVAYDPDPILISRWQAITHSGNMFEYIVERDTLLQEDLFDAIICELVICTIDDESEYLQVLYDLRQLIQDNGKVILAVCNPFYTFGGQTPLQQRHIPDGAQYEQIFSWEKTIVRSTNRRQDVHRPLHRLRRDLLLAGFVIEAIQETDTVDFDRFEYASDFLILTLRPIPMNHPKVSLLIKTCAMEWKTIETQVKHLVQQLEGPVAFSERVLVIDSRMDGYLRQYSDADVQAHETAVENLLQTNFIDWVIYGPTSPDEIRATYKRWFDLEVTNTHASNGAQLVSTLVGFEKCNSDYILQVDSDIMICRRDPNHNYLMDMIRVFEEDPNALMVSFNICHDRDIPYTSQGDTGSWRVETRAALLHRQRFFGIRPLPNEVCNDQFVYPWYRSVDQLIHHSDWQSYRGGDQRTFFIHPLNPQKQDVDTWMAILDRIEHNYVPSLQYDQVDLVGNLNEWLGPNRTEPFIFVITGRNVTPGRFHRCLDSVIRQKNRDWGAVIIDDGSDSCYGEYMDILCSDYPNRITLLRPRFRRRLLANMVWTIRHVCTNPNSVIIIIDANDSLIGDSVISRVAEEYTNGADMTVGSMIRTDKHVHYPVDFKNPRQKRGGNVWQHLRTFRKYLFDSIPNENFRLNGKYIDIASDWAYMLPMVEIAQNPVFIPDLLYLYEPYGVGKGAEQDKREAIIAKIVAKKPLHRKNPE